MSTPLGHYVPKSFETLIAERDAKIRKLTGGKMHAANEVMGLPPADSIGWDLYRERKQFLQARRDQSPKSPEAVPFVSNQEKQLGFQRPRCLDTDTTLGQPPCDDEGYWKAQLCRKTKTLFLELAGSIEDGSYQFVRHALEHYDSFVRIRLAINSPGGLAHESTRIADLLKAQDVPVTTIAQHDCSSAAIQLFLCGDRRIACEGTVFDVHIPRMIGGVSSQEEAAAVEREAMNYACMLAEKSCYGADYWLGHMQSEDTLSVEYADHSGIATERADRAAELQELGQWLERC